METATQNGFEPLFLEEKPFDLRGFLYKYLFRHWYLYIIFLSVSATGAWLYLRYTLPKYEAKCTLLIKSDQQNGGLTEEKLLGELGIINTDKNLENEIQILKSRTLMEQVVDELGFGTKFLAIGRVVESELYGDSPIRLDSFVPGKKRAAVFDITLESYPYFVISRGDFSEKHQFGIPFTNVFGTFLISRDTAFKMPETGIYKLVFSNPENLATYYASALSVNVIGQFSNVLELKLTDLEPRKAEDILNKLVEVYNRAAIEDKNKVNTNTLQFIEDRLGFLTRELGDVERGLEKFKKTNDIPVDVKSSADLLAGERFNYDKELARLDIQLNILNSIEGFLKSKANTFEYVPANIGIQSDAVTDLLGKFNELLIQKDRLLRSATPDNPTVSAIDAQLKNLRKNILAAIRDEIKNLQLTRNQTEQRNRQLNTRTTSLPRIEREFLEIYRQQNIKEQLYLFLLQKREETTLSMAVTPSSSRVIDPGKANPRPVEPKLQLIYALSIMLGIGIPVLIIVLKDLLNDKIQSQEDLESETKAPVLGGIGQSRSGKQIVVSKGSRSSIAEM
ncbi:MAG: GumC family protein, partial [Saprospiraceae bacterium]